MLISENLRKASVELYDRMIALVRSDDSFYKDLDKYEQAFSKNLLEVSNKFNIGSEDVEYEYLKYMRSKNKG
jgi:hypothetical protein